MKKYLSLVLLLLCFSVWSQNRDAKKGEKLYKINCKICHDLDKKGIGPPLRNIEKKKSNKWLHLWIKDNKKLRDSGDKDAIAIYKEYNGMVMQTFPNLTKENIENILEYTTNPPQKEVPKKVLQVDNTKKNQNEKLDIVLVGAIIILLMLIITVLKSRQILKLSIGKEKYQKILDEVSLFKNKYVISTILFILIIGGLYLIWNLMLNIGSDKGYQPIQPIAFSHKIHAGDNKIDCQYCHSSSRNSKTAGVPSANVCMNCTDLYKKEELQEKKK